MRHFINILTSLFFGLLIASCDTTTERSDYYPHDRTASDSTGQPIDSLTFYFPSTVKQNGQTVKTDIDTFLLQWYSSALYAFKEPILYSFYQGHDIYRFLWLRSFHRPVSISLHKDGDEVWLTTKVLDREPEFLPHFLEKIVLGPPDTINSKDSTRQPEILFKPDRHANIILNQTKTLSSTEWEKFESLLTKCNFWTMKPVDRHLSTDGAEWIIEAHHQDKYFYIVRKNSQDSYIDCGKYLIELSGLKEEIY